MSIIGFILGYGSQHLSLNSAILTLIIVLATVILKTSSWIHTAGTLYTLTSIVFLRRWVIMLLRDMAILNAT